MGDAHGQGCGQRDCIRRIDGERKMTQRNWEFTGAQPQAVGLIPVVIEQSGRGGRARDIYSRLPKHRGGFLVAPVTPRSGYYRRVELLLIAPVTADACIQL